MFVGLVDCAEVSRHHHGKTENWGMSSYLDTSSLRVTSETARVSYCPYDSIKLENYEHRMLTPETPLTERLDFEDPSLAKTMCDASYRSVYTFLD